MSDQPTQPVRVSQPDTTKPDTTKVLPLIQRIEKLTLAQARIAMRALVVNNPAVCQAVADVLEIAESYE